MRGTATAEGTMDRVTNMATRKKKGEAEFQMLQYGAGSPNGSCHVKGLNHGAPTAVTHAHVPDTARMDSSTLAVTGLSDNFTAVRSFSHHLGMGDGLTGLGIAHVHRTYACPAKVEQWQAIEYFPLNDFSAWPQKSTRCHPK